MNIFSDVKRTDWAAHEVVTLLAMWAEGKTGQEISLALVLRSRDAVLAKARRMRLNPTVTATGEKLAPAERPETDPRKRRATKKKLAKESKAKISNPKIPV